MTLRNTLLSNAGGSPVSPTHCSTANLTAVSTEINETSYACAVSAAIYAAVLADDQRQFEMAFDQYAYLEVEAPNEGELGQVQDALNDLERLEGEMSGQVDTSVTTTKLRAR